MKYILPILLIAGILVFSFAIYNYTKENLPPALNANSVNNINDKNNPDDNPINNDNNINDINTKATSEDGGSGGSVSGSGGGSGGGSGNSDTIPPEDRINESSCVLIRPGNLPDINCFVNYIKKDTISIEIENKLGEDIGINLDLKTCSPKINDEIKNNEKKDFIFNCNNNDYFNEDLIITYILKENGTVNVGGFVNGPVSS